MSIVNAWKCVFVKQNVNRCCELVITIFKSRQYFMYCTKHTCMLNKYKCTSLLQFCYVSDLTAFPMLTYCTIFMCAVPINAYVTIVFTPFCKAFMMLHYKV